MKKIFRIIIPLLLCMLLACKKSENDSLDKKQVDEEYEKTYYDCGMSMCRRINEEIFMDGSHIYFGSLTANEDRMESIAFYACDLYCDRFPQYIGLTCDYVWNMHYTIRHISEDLDGILYILKVNHEDVLIEEYEGEGRLKEFLRIPINTFSGTDIISFAIDNVGNILILTENSLLGIMAGGKTLQYEMPKVDGVIKVFTIKGKMYCLGREKNNNGDYRQKIFSFNENGNIDKSLEIPDGGMALTVLDEEIYFYVDALGIFKVDSEMEEYQQIVDLSQEKKTWNNVVTVAKKGELYGLVYQSLADQAYRTVLFNPEIKRSKDRVEILLYDPMECLDWYCPLEIIESFNETNQYYHISIAEYKKDMNYILVSEEQPDIVLLDEENMFILGQEGHLQDLSVFLDDDSKLRDEMLDGMMDKISYNKKIYGIPRQFEISTMAIHSSEISELSGWTIDEFLDWLLSDSSSLKESWINKSEILRVCLEGGLNQYIDFEKGECYFDQDDFCRHLEKIAEIREYPTKERLSAESGKIRYISLEGFYKLLMRKDNADPWVYKGFPTFDGKERHIIHFNALSILKASKNAEGAFEFVKYFMRYPYDRNYLFYTDYPVLQKTMEIAQTEYWEMMNEPNHLEAVSQKEIDIFKRLYENSEVTDVSSMDIENMVMEETSFFILGEKELKDVVNIVQNRIQLMLSERKSNVP